MDYEVIPHIGIGPVRLGMPRDQVRSLMPGPCHPFRKVAEALHATDAFHESGFQVFYSGTTPVVEYIELSRDAGFHALYRGVDVFATPADEVVSRVARDAAFDPDDPELGHPISSRPSTSAHGGQWPQRRRRAIPKVACSRPSGSASQATMGSEPER